ncbi:MAG: hypothetical protein R3D25_11025 [Geminicoccaceae bacterium]
MMIETTPTLGKLLAARLEAELGDQEVASALAAILAEDALAWRASVIGLASVKTIIGFTFGNRMLANGNREPGPVNRRWPTWRCACTRRRGHRSGRSGRWPSRSPGGCRPAWSPRSTPPAMPGRSRST